MKYFYKSPKLLGDENFASSHSSHKNRSFHLIKLNLIKHLSEHDEKVQNNINNFKAGRSATREETFHQRYIWQPSKINAAAFSSL